MQNLTLNLIFIIPILGLIAGLSLSIIIPLFMMAGLYIIKNNIQVTLTKLKLELLFFLWLFLSCIWSINALFSFLSLIKIFSLAIVTYILVTHKKFLLHKIPLEKQRLAGAIIGSLILFYIDSQLFPNKSKPTISAPLPGSRLHFTCIICMGCDCAITKKL